MTKILVIEDEPLLREHISQVLGFEDYEVYSAPDGSAGIDMAVEVQPDLIVSDIMLPGADGYQVLEAVRSVGALARTPFIFLSAKADKGDVRQGMELGAED